MRAKATLQATPGRPGPNPYASNQAMDKAVKKAEKNLPASPKKKFFAAATFAKRAGLEISKSTQSHGNRMGEETTASLLIMKVMK